MIFRFRYDTLGIHTHVRLYAGRTEGALGYCGGVAMRNEEWQHLRPLLEAGQNLIGLPADIQVEFIADGQSL